MKKDGLPRAKESGAIEAAAAAMRRGVELHQRGRLGEAEAIYRAVLAEAPRHFDALHLLGAILQQKGFYAESAELIARALMVNPNVAAAHSNLGNALRRMDRLDDALASYDRALALAPDFADAHNNRGNVLSDLQHAGLALASYERALDLKPDYAEAHNNRANALARLNRNEDALAAYDRALELKPNYAEAQYNRANALAELGRGEEALASYDAALRLKSDYLQALNNRGNLLRKLKRPAEALQSFDRALALKPDQPEALSNRGNVLLDLARAEEALASYDRSVQLKPDYAPAWNNRGDALRELGRFEEAVGSFDRALQLKPGLVDALHNRGAALLSLKRFAASAAAFADLLNVAPKHDYALGYRLHAQLHACDWSDYDASSARIAAEVAKGERRDLPFAFLAHCDNPAAQLACARLYVGDKYPAAVQPLWKGERYRHDKIRVAYFASTFHDHPVSHLIAGLFEAHDRTRFEISAVSFGPDRQVEMRARLRRSFDRFIDVREKADDDVARMIRQMEIDIAVDLNGLTEGCRPGIFARRPAPLQVNYLGYPGTSGADYFDYIIADAHVIPDGQVTFYSEKIVRLPDSYQVNDAKRRIAERVPTRAELGLPEGGFVFCCFNNSYKIAPRIFDIWMRLLKRVDKSVLWLLQDNAEAPVTLKREAERRGVAADRIVFAPRVPLDEHLARHGAADLFLDTLPYNAHTTGSDALWAGLPLVTCRGEGFASRVAGSLLQGCGLSELIAADLNAYEALALQLASEPEQLAAICAKLARNRATCALFNTDRFRRHIEAAYVTMHQRHQRGEPPASFDVS